MVLGIIGKIGSGKSVCVEYIEKNYNAIVFSCDSIAKELMASGKYEYGKSEEIFTSENLQEKCRNELHPLVFDRINKQIKNILNKNNSMNFNENIVIIESALPSKALFDMCDKVICIESDYNLKTKLLKDKRGYNIEKTKKIYDSQKYYEKFYDMADIKIINDGSKSDLEKKIKEVIDEIYFICK